MEIPIDKIEIGKSQARVRKVKEDLEDLIESIQKIGLIQPITVYQKDDGNYELIAGQRRFLAVKELGWNNIKAEIIEKPDEPLKAKMMSLTENIVRKDMVDLDAIDAATEAYKKYGTLKAVSEITGLSRDTVSKYVKFDRLPKQVQKAVADNEIKLQTALDAADALTWDSGEIEEEEKVLEMAKEMERLSGTEKRKAKEIAQSDPGKSINYILSETKKPGIKKPVTIELWMKDYERLNTYSESEQIGDIPTAAALLVLEGLTNKGYKENDAS